jgi:hypothetical protein
MASPIGFRIDSARQIAIVAWPDAEVDIDTWTAAFDDIFSHPDFRPEFGIISDRLAVNTPPVSSFVLAVLQVLTREVGAGRFAGRLATVVRAGNIRVFAMWQAMETLSEDTPVRYRVFTTIADAVKWASPVLSGESVTRD